MALIEPSGFFITISSIPDREARKYFTELEGDRSDLRQNTAGICDRGTKYAKTSQKWRARQDLNLRPSA